jgi:transcription elongation GreA/GreB family factor
MTDKAFVPLLEEGRFEELEGYYLQQMESGDAAIEDFLQMTRGLAREKQKDRANLLLKLLADNLRSKGRWSELIPVLLEMAKYANDPEKFENSREGIATALREMYADRPSYQQIMRHARFEEIKQYADLKQSIEKVKWWLEHDIGQAFYQSGYGVGKVVEINLNLALARLDFEKRKDVAVQFGERELIPLGAEHILREKVDAPEQLSQKAISDPPGTLARLLRQLGRPMTTAEIKEAFSGVVPAAQWTRWWTAAKKNPQIIASGKGAQATYEWIASTDSAESSLKYEFDRSDSVSRIRIARQNADRSEELARHFSSALLEEARHAFEKGNWGLALEFVDLFARWPDVQLHYSFEDVLKTADPHALLQSIENSAMKQRVLQAFPEIHAGTWRIIYFEWFLKEDNPKIHSLLFESLNDRYDLLIERILQLPGKYPAAFTWLATHAEKSEEVGGRLDGKFLVTLFSSIDEPEFSSYKTRLKKTIEEGLLLYLLAKQIEPEVAKKALDVLEHTRNVEEYRRERWMARIRMTFPQMNKKEDILFTTKEAYERKRLELEQLIKVELPKNRKAIGEAAAMGDLRENFEYKAARQRQDFLINRVEQLQGELSRARAMEPDRIDSSEVRPGTRITLFQAPDKRTIVTILGPWESNPGEGIYSYQAPVGQALLGKTAGETVKWNEEDYVIEKIEPWM